jgi:putative peptidoglycan lipid II flippase
MARAGGIMVASLFLSRVLGFVRDMVITAKFGQSDLTDAYIVSFQIPDLLFYLIAGGALSSAFIPVFTEYLHTDREDDAWHVFSVVVTVMSAIVLVFIAFAWFFAVPLVHLVAPDIPEANVPLVAQMSRVIVPAQYAFFIGGIMLGTLYARNVFSVPGLAPNIYNIGIIVGALVVSNVVVPGVVGMSWGALVGAFVGNIFIPLLVIRKLGVRFKLSFDTKHEGVRKVFRLMLPVVLGLSLPGVFVIIIRYFASSYPVGVVSALDFANRLMQAPLGVFGQALALAAFPALSQFYAQKRMDMFGDQLSRSLRTVVFLTVPIAVLFVVVPLPIVQAMYQRGSFTLEDAQRTAPALQMFGIGVAAWCVQPLLMRAYFSVQKTWPPVLMGTVTTALFVGASYLLIRGGQGYATLALAASGAALFLAVVMLVAVNRGVCKIDLGGVGTTALKSLLAGGVAAGFAWGALRLSEPLGGKLANFGLLAVMLVVFLCAAWVYYFTARLLRMPEADTVSRSLRRGSPN